MHKSRDEAYIQIHRTYEQSSMVLTTSEYIVRCLGTFNTIFCTKFFLLNHDQAKISYQLGLGATFDRNTDRLILKRLKKMTSLSSIYSNLKKSPLNFVKFTYMTCLTFRFVNPFTNSYSKPCCIY